MKVQNKIFIIFLVLVLLIPSYAILTEKDQPKEPKPIGMEDMLAWKHIGANQISNDGKWFTYVVSPNEGDSEIFIKETKGDSVYTFQVGEAPRFGLKTSFSDDSKWFVFTVYPSENEKEKAKKSKNKLYNNIQLIELSTGKKTEFEKVRDFSFAKENSEWLALHKYAPESQSKEKEKWDGSDLILYNLSTKATFNIGNVSQFTFDKKGRWLAWTIDAQEKSGNGVQLRILAKDLVLSLDSDTTVYKRLSWTEEGDGLTALKGFENKDFEDKLYSVIGFKNFSTKGAEKIEYNPTSDTTFPKGMTISPNNTPEWTEDLTGILFGIHEVKESEAKKKEDEKKAKEEEKKKKEAEAKADSTKADTTSVKADTTEAQPKDKKSKMTKKEKKDEEEPELVIWHGMDKRLQSMQQVQESRDKNFSYLCIYRVKENKFIRLADDEVKDVSAAPKQKWAVGFDIREYELEGNLDGQRYQDIYVFNLKTGEKKLALKKCRWYFGESPDGSHLLYYQDKHYHTYDMASGKSYNISQNVPTSFVDAENDLNIIDPPIRPVGWVKDGVSVLLYDNWDVWNVPVHGGKGKNLTVDGKEKQIRYERRFRLDPEEKGIDLSQPVYFRVYGEWTKKMGIARIDKGKTAKMLLWDDAAFYYLDKAKNADVYLFTKETYKDCPEYYVSDKSLQNGKKLTDTNPQQKDFLWSSGVKLIDYQSKKGDKLQAALFLPANYEEGKSYPTVVYIYEKLSQNMNRYYVPNPYGFNKSYYTSNGYAVLMPDIVYTVNDPGMSAVWCVLPAIEAAVATGIVDKENVGLQGHSWGGYQTAFLITQTDLFKAAVAGAPLTNLISMYSSVYWNSGSANQPIFESSQGRFTGGYWENIEAYTRNSPVYYAQNVTTPLMLLHNDKDGAVDWNQGIEYYNTLRRLNKSVVMLQYKGENHGLNKMANRKDYTVRMKEFFDHHLKGADAPKWLIEGVPLLKMKDHLKERAEKKDKKEKEKTE